MRNTKKIYIGLVGEAGSGKDTSAEALEQEFKAKVLTSSYLLKKSLSVFLDKISRRDYIWFVKKLIKRYGDDIISRAMLKSMEEFDNPIMVFNGVRLPSDYQILRKLPNNYLIYITAGPKIRWSRTIKRKEKSDDNASFEEFLAMHQEATEVNVPKIGAKADYKIVNDGTKQDLEQNVIKVMKDIIKKSKK
ncbi:MAG: hypothetical protein GF332_00750 [Candidatus Moranbacteria bacterium]|nr:hypothetical protein [Candidatus Moranbacteria bacterium]